MLIVAERHDQMAPRLVSALEARDCSVRTLDASTYPDAFTMTFAKHADARGRVTATDIATMDHHAVVYRQSRRPKAPETASPRVAQYIATECYRFLHDVWASLQTAWFPAPPDTIRRAQNKLLQLQLAAELGLRTPPTLITNDPVEARAFWNCHEGRIISKAPSEAFHVTFGQELARFTEPMSSAHLHGAQLTAVRGCPTLFQALVPKRRELRVTVVDQRTFVGCIYSQETRRTRIDWRRYDHGATRYAAGDLPAATARACVALTAKLGLRYAAIDLIETRDNELVFLEINPGGQWGWMEDACDLPITATIVDAVATTAHHRRDGHER